MLTVKKTYLETRLAEIGISEAENATYILDFNENDETYQDAKKEPAQWFTATPEDDIKIIFKKLNGRQMSGHVKNVKNVKDIYRLCYSPAKRALLEVEAKARGTKPAKYYQPPGTGSIIFHTQGIIDAYNAGTQVPTLYMVEGEFKAFVTWHRSLSFKLNSKQKQYKELMYPPSGMPIMGLTGYWNFKGDDGMHEDIKAFILKCNVKNIVLMYDRDLLDLPRNYDRELEAAKNKDVGERITNFCRAAIAFKEMYKGAVSDIYLAPLDPKGEVDDLRKYKGIDDLLVGVAKVPNAVNNIIYELVKAPADGARSKYITVHNLIGKSTLDTKNFFKQKVSDFYNYHADVLDTYSFKFQGSIYQMNLYAGKVEMQAHRDSFVFARIETNWYKILRKPDNRGNQIRQISKTSVANLTLDYVKKGYPNFLQTIDTYDDFINIAINEPDKYQRKIVSEDGTSSFYNLYEPIDHVPIQGPWPTIAEFLKHIFADQYIHALDYIYMTYLHPVVKLPCICLVSEERNTGKTTFITFIKDIFKENVAIIGNAELGDRFNDDYASKLVIAVDEGIVEKTETAEKIKYWVTADFINMDKKNSSRTTVDFIGHMMMTSNHPKTFMRISEDEDRFWVRYIPATEKSNPMMRTLMQDEIPAFLYYLKYEHELNTKTTQSRLYFDKKDLETEALNALKDRSQSQFIRNFRGWMQEQFREYNAHPESDYYKSLHYTVAEIKAADKAWDKLDSKYIEAELERAGYLPRTKGKTCMIPGTGQVPLNDTMGILFYPKTYKTKRGYDFHISDFLEDDEIEDFAKNEKKSKDLPF